MSIKPDLDLWQIYVWQIASLGPTLKTPSLPTLRGEITLNQQQLLDILWRLAAVDLAKRGRSEVSESLRGGLIQELGDFVWSFAVQKIKNPCHTLHFTPGLGQDLNAKALDNGEDAHHCISTHVRVPHLENSENLEKPFVGVLRPWSNHPEKPCFQTKKF